MLKLSRRVGESLLIGADVEIEIIDIRRGQVQIGIRAPREVVILRREIVVTMRENTIAAAAVADDALASLLDAVRVDAALLDSSPGRTRGGSDGGVNRNLSIPRNAH